MVEEKIDVPILGFGDMQEDPVGFNGRARIYVVETTEGIPQDRDGNDRVKTDRDGKEILDGDGNPTPADPIRRLILKYANPNWPSMQDRDPDTFTDDDFRTLRLTMSEYKGVDHKDADEKGFVAKRQSSKFGQWAQAMLECPWYDMEGNPVMVGEGDNAKQARKVWPSSGWKELEGLEFEWASHKETFNNDPNNYYIVTVPVKFFAPQSLIDEALGTKKTPAAEEPAP